ncbi:serine hydrolase domain-containing protein [Parafilimonas sp.]|uniref:serine hydrolase domain-containing protein n=1 Tax=Parafilimonas sp. TaxID=1969739 RepID=UPI0039E3AA86
MSYKKSIAALLFVIFFIKASSQSSLPRSTPEAEGVVSKNIIQFLDAAGEGKTEFHSFMMLRHGKVVAEGWWNPYSADLKHTLYSTSKSFTATAIGFAVSEKLLSVDDKVVSFFPNDLPDTVSSFLSALTVKNVLSMSDGQEPDPTGAVVARDSNWVKGFLSTPILHYPGTQFLYNSLGTYMLAAIVQKVTGQKVIDYLKPRLFGPLGIEGEDWETDAGGINTGGWGLRLKTEDMAKFGQLFLQKGNWNGKQIIPASWVEEATSAKILQDPDAPQSKRDSSDWLQGYCYQMWRCRNEAYRGDGAFGQYIIIIPKKDAVVAITAETPDMQEEINLIWKYLLPALHDEALPADAAALSRLKEKLASLALPLPASTSASSVQKTLTGKTFKMQPNEKNIQSISFKFNGDVCYATITDTAAHTFAFGLGKWVRSTTTMHGPNLVAGAKNNLNGLPAFVTDGAYRWVDNKTLALTLRFTESPHAYTYVCSFDGKKVNVNIKTSFYFGKGDISLAGETAR